MKSSRKRSRDLTSLGFCFDWKAGESSFGRTMLASVLALILFFAVSRWIQVGVPSALASDGEVLNSVRVFNPRGNQAFADWLAERVPQTVLSPSIGELSSVEDYLARLGLEEEQAALNLYTAPIIREEIQTPALEKPLPSLPQLPELELAPRKVVASNWAYEVWLGERKWFEGIWDGESGLLGTQLAADFIVDAEGCVVLASFGAQDSTNLANELRALVIGRQAAEPSEDAELRALSAEFLFQVR